MVEIREHLRGPWKAFMSQGAWVYDGDDPFGGFDNGDTVDISIRRASALPVADGHLPGTCRSGDLIELWEGLYFEDEDDDPTTTAGARWAQARAMADGLNAAWRANEPGA